MNEKQIKELLKQLKNQFKKQNPNKTEEDIEHMILDLFFKMFCEDKMDRADLSTLTEALGYEVKSDVLDQVEKEKKGGH